MSRSSSERSVCDRSPFSASMRSSSSSARSRASSSNRSSTTDNAAEMCLLAERTLDSRRGDVDGVLAQVIAQHVRHALAKGMVDAPDVVDEDGEAFRGRQLDGEHFGARQGALDLGGDLPYQLPFFVVS